MGSTGLLLGEQFFLLSLTGGGGRDSTSFDEWTNGPVAAAMLDDLFLARRLNFDAAGRVVADPTPTGDPTLDALLATIARADKPRSLRRWVGRSGMRATATRSAWPTGSSRAASWRAWSGAFCASSG